MGDTYESRFQTGEDIDEILEAADEHIANTSNPHAVTADQVIIGDSDVETEILAHRASTMPHEFTDQRDGKKYRFGLQVSTKGAPQLIYEEVIA